jgi:hypothetical protein
MNLRTLKKVKLSEKDMILCNDNIKVIIFEDWLGYKNTTVILEDKTQATAWIKPDEVYNEYIGITVAYLKAKNKQDLKKIKEIKNRIENRIYNLRML